MNTQKEEPALLEKVKAIFTDCLKSKGLRRTPERYAILEEIYKQDQHFDAHTLYVQMKDKPYDISRATIYNALELLVDCKLITKHAFHHDRAEYEKSYMYKQHDHLICTTCKKMFEFCDPRMYQIQTSVEEVFQLKIIHHALLLYGTCHQSPCKHKEEMLQKAAKQKKW